MKRYIENRHGKWDLDEKLSDNFTLWEMTLGAKYMPEASHKYMIEEFTSEIYIELKLLCQSCLQKLRDKHGAITINCGFRPKKWDLDKGRTGNSQHCLGKAADIYIHRLTLSQAHQECLHMFPEYGIAVSYKGYFVHIDSYITNPPRRWTY